MLGEVARFDERAVAVWALEGLDWAPKDARSGMFGPLDEMREDGLTPVVRPLVDGQRGDEREGFAAARDVADKGTYQTQGEGMVKI